MPPPRRGSASARRFDPAAPPASRCPNRPCGWHAIAAYRSRRVDVRRWVERLTQLRDSFKRLPTSFDSIQGILNRLQLLAEGRWPDVGRGRTR
jgi:hypothetical protein